MTILALEFSSEQRSAAVMRDGLALAEASETDGRNMAAFSMIEKVLAQAKIQREEIQIIAVGLGPGSYTGVRAAIALAQGWELARSINAIGLSSAAAIAEQARMEKLFGCVNVVVNAQRQEFYLAEYQITETACAEIAPLKILPLADVQLRESRGEILIGPEAETFFKSGRAIFPHAAALAQMAAKRNDFTPAEKLEPIYLRETTFVKAPLAHR